MDRDLAELVSDTLHRVDGAESARPAPSLSGPDWARLQAGMARGRRRVSPQQLRRAIVLGAAVAVALIGTGVATGLSSGLFPKPATVSKSHAQQLSALYSMPTKGSLKNDAAWLAALRTRLTSGALGGTGAMAGYRPADPDKIKIEFAGDIGAFRLVMAEGIWTKSDTKTDSKTDTEPTAMQWWFKGPAGASAAQMVPGASLAPPGGNVIFIALADPAPADPAADQPPATIVVVRAVPAPVKQVTGGPVIDASARVSVPGPMLAPDDGVYVAVPAGRHPTVIHMDGEFSGETGSAVDDQTDNVNWTTQMRTPLRGGPVDPITPAAQDVPGGERGMVVDFNRWLADVVQSRRSDGTFQLLASAPPVDDSGQTGRSMAGMFTLPSGARVFGVLGVAPDGEKGDLGATYGMPWLMAATLVPASVPVDDLSMVWVQRDGVEGPVPSPSVPGWGGAIGPAGTTTIEWTHADGTTTTSPATYSMATTRDTSITGARFLDKRGQLISTQMVRPALSPAGQLELLPAIQEALSR